MKKLLLLSIIIVFSEVLKAQNFPYLNASTGNSGQYIVDGDTSIFMYSGNRIEKLDKNFNPIWIKTYSGLTFENLLLSKTGSLFFIAQANNISDNVGKIERDGNLAWCKALGTTTVLIASTTTTISQLSCNHLMLDRNNQLAITGNCLSSNSNYSFFYKFDTLGNVIKRRLLNNNMIQMPTNLTVLSDSSGYYLMGASCTIVGTGPQSFLIKYNDMSNTFKWATIGGQVDKYLKSKNNPNTYYCVSDFQNPNFIFTIKKFQKVTEKWAASFNISAYKSNNIDEDFQNNVLISVNSHPSASYPYNGWVLKLDSNGLDNDSRVNFIQNLYDVAGQNYNAFNSKLNSFIEQSHFYSFERLLTPSDPIEVALVDTSLSSLCYTTSTINTNNYPNINTTFSLLGNEATFNIPSYFINPVTPIVTTIFNLSISQNNCLVLSTKTYNINKYISVFPNPATNAINITASESFAILESHIYDVNGKLIFSNTHQTNIDVSKLNSGIYFINVVTDKGEHKQKFIKE